MNQDQIKIMQLMFGAFVTNKSKSFKSSCIKDQSYNNTVSIYNKFETTSHAILLTYDNDGVKMRYHFRMCTHLGDTDTFVDRYVECDGKVLLNTEYENPPYENMSNL